MDNRVQLRLRTLNGNIRTEKEGPARSRAPGHDMAVAGEENRGGGGTGFAGEMEVEAYRRLFPIPYYERHLLESVRPDGRPLSSAWDTSIALGFYFAVNLSLSLSLKWLFFLSPNPCTGAVSSADGSALVKTGDTTMLAAIKLEVMTPSPESPDEGSLAVDFHMPPICSPLVRPGRPAELAPVISKQLSDVISSSRVIDLKELSLVSGKAAWMAYLDIYCLNADGSLFDAALLSAVAAIAHLHIPLVSLNDDGRVIAMPGEHFKGKTTKEVVNKDKRKLSLGSIPFSLTCLLHKEHILADPTAEEESIMDAPVTVVLNSKGMMVSMYKPGGGVLALTSTVQDCLSLTRKRVTELQNILDEALNFMEVDED